MSNIAMSIIFGFFTTAFIVLIVLNAPWWAYLLYTILSYGFLDYLK